MTLRHRQTVPFFEQLGRCVRWHRRLEALYKPDETHESYDFVDYYLTLFQNLFACRDWLLGTPGLNPGSVETLFKSPELKLIRDIANGMKHLTINDPSIDAEFAMVQEYDPDDGVETSAGPVEYVLLAGGEKHPIRQLASNALSQIHTFAKGNGLFDRENEMTAF